MTFEYEDSGIKESFFGKLKTDKQENNFTLERFEMLKLSDPKIFDAQITKTPFPFLHFFVLHFTWCISSFTEL